MRCAGICALLGLWMFAGAAVAADYEFTPSLPMRDLAGRVLLDTTNAGDRLVAVGERGLVILSDDGGASWRQAQVPVSVTLTAVDFPTAERGWVVGHGGTILHSSDAGASWSLQFDGNEANRQWLELAQSRRRELAAQVEELQTNGDPKGLLEDLEYELEDAVFTAEDASEAVATGPADPLLDVLFLDGHQGWAVGAYGMIYRTDDGGGSWRLAADSLDNRDRYHFYAMASDGSGNLYLSGEAGLLYVSGDGGGSWQRKEVYFGSLFGLAVLADDIYTFGLRGNIFCSRDRGETWQPVANPESFSLYGGAAIGNDRLLLVGAGGGVLSLGADASPRASFQPGRATLSSLAPGGAGEIMLVGTEGVERYVSPDAGDGN